MKTIKFFAIAALFLGFSASAMAQNPILSATASAGATIITPLSIENNQSLEFGNIVASLAGGTVTVAPGATSATYSGVAAPAGFPGTIRSAKFEIKGDANCTFNITMPATDTLAGPVNEKMIITLTKNLPNANNALTGGTSTLYVGGILAVAANQTAGAYAGGFEVTVAYE